MTARQLQPVPQPDDDEDGPYAPDESSFETEGDGP